MNKLSKITKMLFIIYGIIILATSVLLVLFFNKNNTYKISDKFVAYASHSCSSSRPSPSCRATIRTCTVTNICGQSTSGTSRTGCGNSGICSTSAPALPPTLRNLDSIKITSGQTIYVAPKGASPSACYKITKRGGDPIFIPLKTTNEFFSFVENSINIGEITVINYNQ